MFPTIIIFQITIIIIVIAHITPTNNAWEIMFIGTTRAATSKILCSRVRAQIWFANIVSVYIRSHI